MEKIDRLGWAESISFKCSGVRIGIRTTERGMFESLEPVLPPGRAPTSSPIVDRLYSLVVGGPGPRPNVHRMNILYNGAARVARHRELTPVLDQLGAEVRRVVAQAAPRRVFIHAGVVAWRGRAIVIPGRTMSGKSTLVAELLRAGATYYSDEYAVLDERGLVHPFAKPLSLRKPGSYEAIDYSLDKFDAVVGVKPLPIGLVAITHYRAGARWRPRVLSAAQGALAMLSHAVAVRRKPKKVIETLRHAVAPALILKGIRGEAAELAADLFSRIDGIAISAPAKVNRDRVRREMMQ